MGDTHSPFNMCTDPLRRGALLQELALSYNSPFRSYITLWESYSCSNTNPRSNDGTSSQRASDNPRQLPTVHILPKLSGLHKSIYFISDASFSSGALPTTTLTL